MSRKASISILKAHLSQYLDAVKAGEEVIVTERGRPIARLSGVERGAEPDARAARLVREGRMRLPTASLSEGFWDAPRPSDPNGRGLDALLHERSEGR